MLEARLTPPAILAVAMVFAGLTIGCARSNGSYIDSLVYRPPGANASAPAPNEISIGEEIVLSFLKRFIGPEKVKKSEKPGFLEGFGRLVKSVEDLLSHRPKTYSVVTEIPISGGEPGKDGERPETRRVARETDGLRPETDVVQPEMDGVRPETDVVRPEMDGVRPEMDGVRSETDVVRPETDGVRPETSEKRSEGRGKMTDMMFSPYMLIPQLIMLGFSPIVLANLKMFVMQTLMMNQMAFSAALWMTIRNMVFGPSPEPPVKYYNFGYEKPHHAHPHTHHSHRRRSVPGRRRIDK